MDETRKVAHRLLDELPDRFVLRAKDELAALKSEAARDYFAVLNAAPEDDEAVDQDDLDALRQASEEHAHGKSRPWRHAAGARRRSATR